MSLRGTNRIVCMLCCGVFWNWPVMASTDSSGQEDPAAAEQSQESAQTRSYTVEKKVSDFPSVRDLSTPEAAYATIMREFMATGASGDEWSAISVREIGRSQRQSVSPGRANSYLNARILEVIIYRDREALVIAEMESGNGVGYDQRFLFYVKDRWLNSGHDGLAPTIEQARDAFSRKCRRKYQINLRDSGEYWNRASVADPNAYLRPYVEFLKSHGREPHAFLMEAFGKYRLVVMGEVHNRPAYWAFNSELVRDRAFAERVRTIYMELPSNHQENIDRFLTQDTCEKELVIQMLRDFASVLSTCSVRGRRFKNVRIGAHTTWIAMRSWLRMSWTTSRPGRTPETGSSSSEWLMRWRSFAMPTERRSVPRAGT